MDSDIGPLELVGVRLRLPKHLSYKRKQIFNGWVLISWLENSGSTPSVVLGSQCWVANNLQVQVLRIIDKYKCFFLLQEFLEVAIWI